MVIRNPKCLLPHAILLTLLVPICLIAQTQKQPAYLILLDNTGSMKTQFPQVQALAKTIVKRLHQNGPISIVTFKTQGDVAIVNPGIDWEQDENKLMDYIDAVSTVTGQTALFDAVASAADTLVGETNSLATTEKILILITDGDDRMRRGTGMIISSVDEDDRWRKARDELAKKLKQSGITTYAIGLTRELDADTLVRLSPRQKAESFLMKVAKQTGGRAVISTSKKIDADKIVRELLGP